MGMVVSMIINKPACDYLTVTTWHRGVYDVWQRLTEPDGAEWRVKKMAILGYVGYMTTGSRGSIFLGMGKQYNKLMGQEAYHYMARVSGEVAESFAIDMEKAKYPDRTDWQRRRIDFQVTVPLPDGYSAMAFYDALRGEWAGRSTKLRIIANDGVDKGMDTVYIWSPKSRRYVRMYVKQDKEGYRYLRWEIEIKKELAPETPVSHCVNQILETIEKLPKRVRARDEIREIVAATKGDRVTAVRKTRERNTLAWLQDVVMPAFKKVWGSHQTRGSAEAWIDDLVEWMGKASGDDNLTV